MLILSNSLKAYEVAETRTKTSPEEYRRHRALAMRLHQIHIWALLGKNSERKLVHTHCPRRFAEVCTALLGQAVDNLDCSFMILNMRPKDLFSLILASKDFDFDYKAASTRQERKVLESALLFADIVWNGCRRLGGTVDVRKMEGRSWRRKNSQLFLVSYKKQASELWLNFVKDLHAKHLRQCEARDPQKVQEWQYKKDRVLEAFGNEDSFPGFLDFMLARTIDCVQVQGIQDSCELPDWRRKMCKFVESCVLEEDGTSCARILFQPMEKPYLPAAFELVNKPAYCWDANTGTKKVVSFPFQKKFVKPMLLTSSTPTKRKGVCLQCDHCDVIAMVKDVPKVDLESLRSFPIQGNESLRVLDNNQKSIAKLRLSYAWKTIRRHCWKNHIDRVGYNVVAGTEYGFSELMRSNNTSSRAIRENSHLLQAMRDNDNGWRLLLKMEESEKYSR